MDMTDPKRPGADTPSEPLFSEMAHDEEMADLVEFFVDELQHRIDALSNAFDGGDVDELQTLAHQLKGAAGGYGFPAISETAMRLEQHITDGTKDISRLAADVEALIKICRRASV